MLCNKRKYADNVSACTLCLSCNNVCPVKVNPGSQIYVWRQQLDSIGKADKLKKVMSEGMDTLFLHPSLYTAALKAGRLLNIMPEGMTHFEHLNPWSDGHDKPHFASESFHELWKKGKVK